MNQYNVLTEHWMPVEDANHSVVLVSPFDIFSKRTYVQLAGDPVENFAMLSFLLGLSQSSTDNQCYDVSELNSIRDTYADNVLTYMELSKDLFWMRGEKPFLQCTLDELGLNKKGKEVSDASLQLRERYAEGNNTVMGAMHQSGYNSPSDVILDLLVRQTYSVAYGKSGAVPTRSAVWEKSTLGILNTYFTGSNLIESIWLNFHLSGNGIKFGVPVWESRFDDRHRNTYLNRLVSGATKIWISDDWSTMKCNVGIDYPNMKDSFVSMETITTKDGDKVDIPVRVRENTRIWKEYSPLFSGKSSIPEMFDDRIGSVENVTINSLGSVYKFSMGIYSTELCHHAAYSIVNPAKKINDEMYSQFYKTAVELADELVDSFAKSLYGVTTDLPQVKSHIPHICNSLWKLIDEESPYLLSVDGTDDDMDMWKRLVLNTLSQAYSQVQQMCGELVYAKLSYTKKMYDITEKLRNKE